MKASEALLLGSKKLIPVRGVILDGYGGGCALGMMMKGGGFNSRIESLQEAYPWLNKIVQSPCGCYVQNSRVSSIIGHLFDQHVTFCDEDPIWTPIWTPTWTIEQLAQWLDSVDPTNLQEVAVEEKQELVEV